MPHGQAERQKDQSDYDLERVIELFDTALTSRDERVVNALRSLLMIVTLTDSEDNRSTINKTIGPLGRMMSDIHSIDTRLRKLESNTYTVEQSASMYDPLIAKMGTVSKSSASMYDPLIAKMGTVSKSSAIDVLKKLSPK